MIFLLVTKTHLHIVGAAPFGPLLVQMCVHQFLDLLRRLVRHNADREFADDLGRDDGFGAGLAEGALDSVQRERRETPPVHQQLDLQQSYLKS